MSRAIVTYATGPHQELLDVALPSYKQFAHKHGYELLATYAATGTEPSDLPAPWHKIPLLLDALKQYEEVVWFDCDLIVVNSEDDFPPMDDWKLHSLVRHFEHCSEVPNSGVWRIKRSADGLDISNLLHLMMELQVFRNHGWWEQAALMTLMGYSVPPQGTHYSDTQCRCVSPTKWYSACQFMRLSWNSHPNYRAEKPRIVHCSYPDMPRRLEVMRALTRNPHYEYPRFEIPKSDEEEEKS